ncbi:MAG: Omp28 family outer membrane lipoprotein [Bacteroidales bacterium]|nr:Omp28 family outer membrane lipoprotein [Bacteroidales bacterium]
MIKGNIFICALASIVLAWGCDKIEANENGLYEEYAGSAITWSEGTSVTTNAGQRAFLEKYTGPKCPNCPTADDSIHSAQRQFGNRLVVVAIHDYSSFGRPLGEIDLRTEKGDNWSSYFGVRNAGSYPSAIINRMHNDNTFDLFMPTTVLSDKIANALTSAHSINMEVTSTLTANTTTIDVNIEFIQKVTDSLTLTIFVMEDSIIAPQAMPNGSRNQDYVHNHILRDVVTDIWGIPVDADGHEGSRRKAELKYTIKPEWNKEHCHIVAFVSNAATREVLNVAECKL